MFLIFAALSNSGIKKTFHLHFKSENSFIYTVTKDEPTAQKKTFRKSFAQLQEKPGKPLEGCTPTPRAIQG